MLKLMRLRQALDVSRDILGQDLLNAAYWMDIRQLEDPTRQFGAGPTAAWHALRTLLPFRYDPLTAAPTVSAGNLASAFMATTPADRFYSPSHVPMPGGDGVAPPRAEPSKSAAH